MTGLLLGLIFVAMVIVGIMTNVKKHLQLNYLQKVQYLLT